MSFHERTNRFRLPRVSWWTIVLALSMFVGCTSPGSSGTNDGQESQVEQTHPWADGEDCSNWGCREEWAAKSSVIAPPANATTCTNSSECSSGFCADGVCCDTACTGTCRACTAAKKGSGEDGICGDIVLYGDPDNECPAAACDGSGHCESYNGVTCTDATECLSGNCVDGVCCGNACTDSCRACTAAKKGGGVDGECGLIAANTDPDEECMNGDCNGSGACTLPTNLLNGVSCLQATQCLSGNCVDGVCCGNACTDSCRACTAAKKGGGVDGECGLIAANTDPDEECMNGDCNGSGACSLPTNLLNGVSCLQAAQCLSGNCVDGVCCGNACTDSCRACTAAKKGGGVDGECGLIAANTDPDEECMNGDCNGSGACSLPTNLLNGVSCLQAAQCLSGNCVDGVCCGNACTESCKACNVPGSIGACTEKSPNACASVQRLGLPDLQLMPGGDWLMATTADMNGDGNIDIIGVDTGTEMVEVLFGNGDGTYAAKMSYQISGDARRVAAGDLNGDGMLDLVVITYRGPVSVLFNNGDGTLASSVDYAYTDVGVYPWFVTIADFNGDGAKDLAIGADGGNKLSIMLNSGNGSFATGVVYPTGTNYGAVAGISPADVNGDGLIDLACWNSFTNAIALLYNQGNGVFAAPFEYTTASSLDSLEAVDINGDGWVDLVTTMSGYVQIVYQYAWGFNNPVKYVVNQGNSASLLSTIDLNGDGKRDIATTDTLGGINVLIGQGNSFAAAVRYAAPSASRYGLFADVNNDGVVDVVMGIADRSLLAQHFGRGDGTFSWSAQYLTSGALGSIAAGDLNGDGFNDLVTAYGGNAMNQGVPVNDGSSRIGVRFNQGNGTFGVVTEYVTAWQPVAVAASDLNGDGKPDVVSTNALANSVSVLLNQGNGTLANKVDYSAIDKPRGIAIGDLNGDGKPDIVAANSNNNTVSVFFNQGNGTFPTRYDHIAGATPFSVALADVNGDGKLDIMTANAGANSASVIMNLGNGTFATFVEYPAGAVPIRIVASDMNGDGKADIVVEHSYISTVSVLLNQGNGTFGLNVDYVTDQGTNGLTVADLNGDGQKDIVALGQVVNVLLNQGNGTFALSKYTPAKPLGNVIAADLNNDGRIDLATGYVDVMLNAGML